MISYSLVINEIISLLKIGSNAYEILVLFKYIINKNYLLHSPPIFYESSNFGIIQCLIIAMNPNLNILLALTK